MYRKGIITAKTFFKMAEYDRRLLTVTRVVSTVLTVSLLLKLFVSSVLFYTYFKKQ